MTKTSYAVLAILAFPAVTPAAVILDDFSTPTMSASSCAIGVQGSTGSVASTNTLSGERTVSSNVTAYLGTSGGCTEARVNTPAGNSVLTVNNDFGVFGYTSISWNPVGAMDLSQETHLFLDIGIDGGIAPNDTNSFAITLCSGTCGSNYFTYGWSISGQVAPVQTFSYALSNFVAVGAPSWSSINRASITIGSGNSSDLRIDNIEFGNAVPEPATAFLAGCALLGLGLLRRRQQG